MVKMPDGSYQQKVNGKWTVKVLKDIAPKLVSSHEPPKPQPFAVSHKQMKLETPEEPPAPPVAPHTGRSDYKDIPKGALGIYAPAFQIPGSGTEPNMDVIDPNKVETPESAQGEVRAMTPQELKSFRRNSGKVTPLKSLGLSGKAAEDAMKDVVIPDSVNTSLQPIMGLIDAHPIGLARNSMGCSPRFSAGSVIWQMPLVQIT